MANGLSRYSVFASLLLIDMAEKLHIFISFDEVSLAVNTSDHRQRVHAAVKIMTLAYLIRTDAVYAR